MKKVNKGIKKKNNSRLYKTQDRLKSDNCIESRPFWILCLHHVQFSAHFLNITATHVKETNKKDPRVSFPLSTLSTSYHFNKKEKVVKGSQVALSLSLSHTHFKI